MQMHGDTAAPAGRNSGLLLFILCRRNVPGVFEQFVTIPRNQGHGFLN